MFKPHFYLQLTLARLYTHWECDHGEITFKVATIQGKHYNSHVYFNSHWRLNITETFYAFMALAFNSMSNLCKSLSLWRLLKAGGVLFLHTFNSRWGKTQKILHNLAFFLTSTPALSKKMKLAQMGWCYSEDPLPLVTSIKSSYKRVTFSSSPPHCKVQIKIKSWQAKRMA